ncbi:MAG: SDR family oxidoreductase [Melioribacteraceae bacterium]|nr:SDR family oxidoreductase [Melioribacteraceae bacterium]
MTVQLFSLENKVAVVTGATGLIGKYHCKALSDAGAKVVVADTDEDNCSQFADVLPTDSIGIFLDVTDRNSIAALKDKVLNEFGRIDILVNNAAINDMVEEPKSSLQHSMFENYSLELWQRSINVNLTGVFLCSQIIGSHFAKQESGSIINIASTYGIVAPVQSLYKDEKGDQKFYKPPAYSATKGGVIAFTRYLAAYWGNRNVRVNALSPGGVENSQGDYFIKQYSDRTPLGRMAAPSDYQGALVFLSSDASRYMTGANLVVDGGWTIW